MNDIYLLPELRDRIKLAANQQHRTLSDVVTAAVERYLQELGIPEHPLRYHGSLSASVADFIKIFRDRGWIDRIAVIGDLRCASYAARQLALHWHQMSISGVAQEYFHGIRWRYDHPEEFKSSWEFTSIFQAAESSSDGPLLRYREFLVNNLVMGGSPVGKEYIELLRKLGYACLFDSGTSNQSLTSFSGVYCALVNESGALESLADSVQNSPEAFVKQRS